MHIVREMLPTLFSQKNIENLSSRLLMREYITHWIERQKGKEIEGAIENSTQKNEFIYSFFKELAAEFYVKKTSKLPADDILTFLHARIGSFNLKDKEDLEGFETEILTAYFVEIENDEYRFVHKSFMEFFISEQILDLLKKGDVKNELISQTDWTEEIINLIYESEDFSESYIFNKNIPLLICLTSNSKFAASLKVASFKLAALFYSINFLLPKIITRSLFSITPIDIYNEKTILISKLVKSIEYLEEDEFFKLDVNVKSVKSQIIEIKSNILNGKVSINKVIKLIDVIEPSISLENDINNNNHRKISIVPKAFYIAFLKNQIPVKGNSHLVSYLRYRYKKEINIQTPALPDMHKS